MGSDHTLAGEGFAEIALGDTKKRRTEGGDRRKKSKKGLEGCLRQWKKGGPYHWHRQPQIKKQSGRGGVKGGEKNREGKRQKTKGWK